MVAAHFAGEPEASTVSFSFLCSLFLIRNCLGDILLGILTVGMN
jgi:hypothetical protein